jgi:hypothetical protein
VGINERHDGITKVGGVQSILCHSRQGLPCDQRLSTSNSACQTTLVIHWPDTVVSDQRGGAIKSIPVGRAIPSTMSRRANSDNIASRRASRARQPHDNSLPVVTVAKARGWLILGHIPRVHQSIVVPISCAANINLAGAATAVTVGGTSRCQASAELISFGW